LNNLAKPISAGAGEERKKEKKRTFYILIQMKQNLTVLPKSNSNKPSKTLKLTNQSF